jgi:hypothetical protein
MESYTLFHPVLPKRGDAISEVLVRRATGKDMRLLDRHQGNPMALTLALIDALTLYPDGAPIFAGFADELDAEDIFALGELVTASLPDGQVIGATP